MSLSRLEESVRPHAASVHHATPRRSSWEWLIRSHAPSSLRDQGLRDDFDILAVGDLLGHQSVDTTMIYTPGEHCAERSAVFVWGVLHTDSHDTESRWSLALSHASGLVRLAD